MISPLWFFGLLLAVSWRLAPVTPSSTPRHVSLGVAGDSRGIDASRKVRGGSTEEQADGVEKEGVEAVEEEQEKEAEVEEEEAVTEEVRRERCIHVSTVTWNMAEMSPSVEDAQFLTELGATSDVIAIGVQEIENLKPRRHEGSRSREWRRILHKTLGADFARVGHHAMGGIQLSVFVKRKLKLRSKLIKMSEVACGVGNLLQNKGAVAAFMRVDKTTFLFVTAHLAAHQGKIFERNGDYWRIVGELGAETPPAWVKRTNRKRKRPLDMTDMASEGTAGGKSPLLEVVDRIFFFGDLNYRVDLSRDDMERGVKEDCGEVLDYDQLTRVRACGDAFGGFAEGKLSFPPTFKYNKGTAEFDTSRKLRVPAWTDRVLYAPGGAASKVLYYRDVPEARHSDHRPVVAHFKVALAGS